MNEIMIQYSDDGGHTWSAENWKPLIGEDKNYLTRVRLHRQGSAFQRIYRLTHSYNGPLTLISAHARIGFGI